MLLTNAQKKLSKLRTKRNYKMYVAILIVLFLACFLIYAHFNPPKTKAHGSDGLAKFQESDIEIPDPYKDDTGFSRDKYIAHLVSDKWKSIKESRLMIDQYKCKQCGVPVSAETSHCHHVTYKNLGNEKLADVVTVCPSCHNAIHEFYGKNAKFYPLIKK